MHPLQTLEVFSYCLTKCPQQPLEMAQRGCQLAAYLLAGSLKQVQLVKSKLIAKPRSSSPHIRKKIETLPLKGVGRDHEEVPLGTKILGEQMHLLFNSYVCSKFIGCSPHPQYLKK